MFATNRTHIIITVAAYITTLQSAYAQPVTPNTIGQQLSLEAVHCVNQMVAYFKAPSPYSIIANRLIDDVIFTSAEIQYSYGLFLNPSETYYEGQINLTKLMLIKSAIAHLKIDRSENSIPYDYYLVLKFECDTDKILIPYKFCQISNEFLMQFLAGKGKYFDYPACMKELEDFDQVHPSIVFLRAYHHVTLSEVANSIYQTAYMRHIITVIKTLPEPTKTGSSEEPSSSSELEASSNAQDPLKGPDSYCSYYTSPNTKRD